MKGPNWKSCFDLPEMRTRESGDHAYGLLLVLLRMHKVQRVTAPEAGEIVACSVRMET